jgi:trimeric autotransporter adhesin
MNQPINLKTTTLAVRNLFPPATAGRGFLLVAVALAWFALLPTARAVTPAPDGGYANQNTAEGTNALFTLTTGLDNTAIGFEALFSNTTGGFNTATGFQALSSNTTVFDNTATGVNALFSNTTGGANTANGAAALSSNTTGTANTATGVEALLNNTTGSNNTANGISALFNNTTGGFNTATGYQALSNNTTGSYNTANGISALGLNSNGNDNTATGVQALFSNTTGGYNTANGVDALVNNTTGSSNIALGFSAGSKLTTGSNNIDIGARGVAGESNTIRIGTIGLQKSAYMQGISGATVASGVTVIVGSNGHLGTIVSSERFKEAIKPMDKASEAILALKPVTFHYKHELDPDGIPQFGLVAEQVEKVNPDLVARDADGKVNTVRYEAVNAMLLNEFLKAHGKVQSLEATVTQLKSTVAQQQKDFHSTIAQQQKEIKALTASLKEQASQIQKVSDKLEVCKPAPQLVADNQ